MSKKISVHLKCVLQSGTVGFLHTIQHTKVSWPALQEGILSYEPNPWVEHALEQIQSGRGETRTILAGWFIHLIHEFTPSDATNVEQLTLPIANQVYTTLTVNHPKKAQLLDKKANALGYTETSTSSGYNRVTQLVQMLLTETVDSYQTFDKRNVREYEISQNVLRLAKTQSITLKLNRRQERQLRCTCNICQQGEDTDSSSLVIVPNGGDQEENFYCREDTKNAMCNNIPVSVYLDSKVDALEKVRTFIDAHIKSTITLSDFLYFYFYQSHLEQVALRPYLNLATYQAAGSLLQVIQMQDSSLYTTLQKEQKRFNRKEQANCNLQEFITMIIDIQVT